MKITFVALNYAPSRGGAQEHVRRVAEGLVARGHEVTVLTTDALRSPASREPGRIRQRQDRIGGVDVRRYPTPQLIARSMPALRRLVAWYRRRSADPGTEPEAIAAGPWLRGPWSPSLAWAVRRAVRTDDVVVGCSAPFTTSVLANWLRPRGGALVASMPLLHASPLGTHPALSRALRTSDLVFASTDFEAGLDRSVGISSLRVGVIPPGVAPQDYPELDPREARARCGLPERPTVGFIGRLAAYKGVDTFLEAAPAIWDAAPDTTVLIAGSATGWDGFRSPAAAAIGGERLVIREGFADDERALLYAACDVVVHPSRDESFGLVALEAWAAHRPVVLADIPCVRSFVEEGRTAEVVAPGDAEGLAATVGDLLADADRRERLAAAGYAEIAERFDWEHICDEWDDKLRALASVER
ncbi:MAG: glycosyltransferase family 4 protein [Aquihabitans sp.]